MVADLFKVSSTGAVLRADWPGHQGPTDANMCTTCLPGPPAHTHAMGLVLSSCPLMPTPAQTSAEEQTLQPMLEQMLEMCASRNTTGGTTTTMLLQQARSGGGGGGGGGGQGGGGDGDGGPPSAQPQVPSASTASAFGSPAAAAALATALQAVAAGQGAAAAGRAATQAQAQALPARSLSPPVRHTTGNLAGRQQCSFRSTFWASFSHLVTCAAHA